MAAAPRRQQKGCSEGQHPSQEPSALNTESPGTPAQHPSVLDAKALALHSPSQLGCLPCTTPHHSGGEELCPKARGALPEQHLSTHGQLLPTGCTRAQGQRDAEVVGFVSRNMKNPQEGQRLEMECSPKNVDNGASWIRQDKDGKLHFIVYISMLSRTTYSGNENTSSEFEGSRQGRFYRLVVKNFRAQDQGTYFCVNYINQVLHFSSGQPACFPGQTLLHPPRLHPDPLPVPSQFGPLPTLPMALLLCPSHLITQALLLLVVPQYPPAPLMVPALLKHIAGCTAQRHLPIPSAPHRDESYKLCSCFLLPKASQKENKIIPDFFQQLS